MVLTGSTEINWRSRRMRRISRIEQRRGGRRTKRMSWEREEGRRKKEDETKEEEEEEEQEGGSDRSFEWAEASQSQGRRDGSTE
jgi:hypothetical protein